MALQAPLRAQAACWQESCRAESSWPESPIPYLCETALPMKSRLPHETNVSSLLSQIIPKWHATHLLSLICLRRLSSLGPFGPLRYGGGSCSIRGRAQDARTQSTTWGSRGGHSHHRAVEAVSSQARGLVVLALPWVAAAVANPLAVAASQGALERCTTGKICACCCFNGASDSHSFCPEWYGVAARGCPPPLPLYLPRGGSSSVDSDLDGGARWPAGTQH